MPEPLQRLTTWFRHLFSSLTAWFQGTDLAQPSQERDVAPPLDANGSLTGSARESASAQWPQTDAYATGGGLPPPRQSPAARPHELTGETFTGAPDITPQLNQLNPLNPQASAPFTPRPLAAHISRPLTSRLDPRLGYPAAFTPPGQPLSGPTSQGMLPSPQTPYQATGPNDDTLPPRATNTPGAPTPPSPGDLDAPTLPNVNLPPQSEPQSEPLAPPADMPPQDIPYGETPDIFADRFTFVGETFDDDETPDDDDLALDDNLMRDLSAQEDALSVFDTPDGSPVTRRRMFFLRYLVRRRVYNEGFAPGAAPPQYYHSLGLDDDGAEDTLPEE